MVFLKNRLRICLEAIWKMTETDEAYLAPAETHLIRRLDRSASQMASFSSFDWNARGR